MSSRNLLTEHHHQLEASCCELLGCTYADDPLDLIEAYRRFEHELLEHLRVEEELLFPAYAEHAPDDARKLREEHDDLRRVLFRIGVDVELHLVRAQTVERLIAELRAHAAREDTGLYAWAATHLSAAAAEQVCDRIERARIESAHIRVEVIDGEAELAGVVDSQHEHDVAIAAAEHVPGIRKVIDHLAITP